jgi:antitoxin component YwqK of YwqJK toxin-antitoxin module
MNRLYGLGLIFLLVLLVACEPVPVQYPPGAAQYPYPNSNGSLTPQPVQITGFQRFQHAWNKAMEGVAMGGSIAGPYGAGGGLIIGLVAGLLTADSHYNQINNQIYSEQQKDQQLEAAIEQELARQRTLENQIAGVAGAPATATTNQPTVQSVATGGSSQPSPPRETTLNGRSENNSALASLNKPVSPQATPKPFKNVEVKDVNGDGIPDLWIYYNPQKPGEAVRQEEATKGDGRVDSWSYFKDGQLVRRDVDSKGTGRPDTVYYYDNDKIAREERDETGQGRMSYRATYQNGRLSKVEKETGGTGRTDFWIYYDTSQDGEVVTKEERDLNGDGIPDLWSYFENGRLVRRDVSAIGLESLSKQEQLPVPTAKLAPLASPGS